MQVATLFGLAYKLKNTLNSILVKTHNLILKKFKQVLINTCDIPLNQISNVYFKWDTVTIKIPNDKYVNGLDSCKNFLRGRIILKKENLFQQLMHCMES